MRAAAAEMGLEPSLNLGIARLRLFLQQSMRAHHHARDAIAALRGLDFDEGTLDWSRLGRRAEPFQRRDLYLGEERNWRHTGEDRFVIDQDRAGAALAEPAAELRGVEFQLVTQHVKERRARIDVEVVLPVVNVELHFAAFALCGCCIVPGLKRSLGADRTVAARAELRAARRLCSTFCHGSL